MLLVSNLFKIMRRLTEQDRKMYDRATKYAPAKQLFIMAWWDIFCPKKREKLHKCIITGTHWQALFDIKTGKDADVHITNIHVDNMNDEVIIVREIGLDVKRIKLTMERAREIEFINLNALSNYC